MPLVFKYHQPGDDDQEPGYVDLGDEVVRWGEFALSQSAGLGEPAVSGLEIDDPFGELNIVGWRAFRVYESSAPSNSQLIYTGRVGDRGVKRMRSFGSNAVSRQWSVDLIDANWYLGNRILVDQDSKRPDETGGDRLRWLLANAAHVYLHDYGHVQYPTNSMDANDYRGQTSKNVLDDIAVAVGYNYWCDVNEAHNARELFFMDPNSDDYLSSIRISNDLSDVDDVTTFAPGDDAELKRSPTRIAFGVYVPYSRGAVYVRNQATGAAFAKVDQTAPNSNIKKASTARNYGTRFLDDNDEEDDKITCWVLMPAAQVNDIRHGHRMYVKFTHLPGYEDFTPVRVLHRTITQEATTAASGVYRLDLELSPTGAETPAVVQIIADTELGGPSAEWAVAPVAGQYLVSIVGGRGGHDAAHVPVGWTYMGYEEGEAGSAVEAAYCAGEDDDIFFGWGWVGGSYPWAFSMKYTQAAQPEGPWGAHDSNDTVMTLPGITVSGPGILMLFHQIHGFDQAPHIMTPPPEMSEVYGGVRFSTNDHISFGFVRIEEAGTYSYTWTASNTYPDWNWEALAVFVPGL